MLQYLLLLVRFHQVLHQSNEFFEEDEVIELLYVVHVLVQAIVDFQVMSKEESNQLMKIDQPMTYPNSINYKYKQ